MAVQDRLFREIMASFPSGVTIVTALAADGTARGLTVSAFCPVSLHPPLVLVCVDRSSNTLAAIRHSGAFTVNLLAAGRDALALRFASKRGDKFQGIESEPAEFPGAGPILTGDSKAHLVCSLSDEVEGGDHSVFIGTVEGAGLEEAEIPLLYGQRTFTTWLDLTE